MTQTAVVMELIGERARIQVKRVSACAHDCERCGGGCSEMMKSAPISVLAKNPLGAKPGDRVVVASDTRSILGAAALVYLFPILMFFVGYFAAGGCGLSEGAALGAGGLCFLLSGIIVVCSERRVRERKRNLFTIVEICKG